MKRALKLLPMVMAFSMMFSTLAHATSEVSKPVALAFKQILPDTYKILSGKVMTGYLLVGKKECLVIGMGKSISKMEKNPYTNGRKVNYTDTNSTLSMKYDLGNRTIQAISLNGAESLLGNRFPVDKVQLSNTMGYVDVTNNFVVTQESIGNGTAVVDGKQTKLLDWGRPYLNMLQFQSSVHKVAKLVDGLKSPVILDGKGNKVDSAYLADLNVLVDKVMRFDKDLVLDFDTTQSGSNYIAKNKSAKLVFDGGSYCFAGYDMIKQTYMYDSNFTSGQYFTIKYKNEFYMLKDTDVQTVYLWMNDTEAFIIDTGMYNPTELASRVKNLIGDRKLSIYITHGHGDHFMNVVNIPTSSIAAIYVPDKETYFKFGASDGSYDFASDIKGRLADKVHYVKDGDILTAAGKQFQVVSVPGHTPYGTGVLDIGGRHFFSGDTLGTQAYIGGTSFAASTLDSWIKSIAHLSDVVGYGTSNSKIDDIFMMHVNAPVSKDYISWMASIMNALKEKKDVVVSVPGAAKGGSLIITKNGAFLNQTEATNLFKNDISGSDLYQYCSITYMADK